MRTVEYWRCWITDPVSGKRRKTNCHMSAETAAGYPGAERVPGTMELHRVPEPGEFVSPQFNLSGTRGRGS